MEDDRFCGMRYGNAGFSDDSFEICTVLELILLLVRITCFSGKKKIVTAVAVFAVSFMFMGVLMNDHRYCLGESFYQPMLQGYPFSVLMTVVIGLLLYLCWAIRSERRRYHHSLSYWSVNEAVNDVPCGVCFRISWKDCFV